MGTRLIQGAISAVVVLSASTLLADATDGTADATPVAAVLGEARGLATQGKYAEACPKFEQSLRSTFDVGTQFELADCWEHLGRTSSAWETFLAVAAAAKAMGQTDRERAARARAAALEPNLSRMVIHVGAQATAIDVQPDAGSMAVTVDPGVHHIVVVAPGKRLWSSRVSVAPGANVIVALPPLEDQPAAPRAGMPPAEQPPAGMLSVTPTEHDRTKSGQLQRTLGIAIGSAGVAGIAAGFIFAVAYDAKNEWASNVCREHPRDCPPSDLGRHDVLLDEARANRTLAYVGFSVGSLALLTGGLLYFTAPPHSARSSWRATPFIGESSYGAALGGTW